MLRSAYGLGQEVSWQNAADAVLEALRADEVVHLPHLPGLEKLWEQFDDSKQDDACDPKLAIIRWITGKKSTSTKHFLFI